MLPRDGHIYAVVRKENRLPLYQYLAASAHDIEFEKTEVLGRVEHRNKREAIWIKSHQLDMNKRDDTTYLPQI